MKLFRLLQKTLATTLVVTFSCTSTILYSETPVSISAPAHNSLTRQIAAGNDLETLEIFSNYSGVRLPEPRSTLIPMPGLVDADRSELRQLPNKKHLTTLLSRTSKLKEEFIAVFFPGDQSLRWLDNETFSKQKELAASSLRNFSERLQLDITQLGEGELNKAEIGELINWLDLANQTVNDLKNWLEQSLAVFSQKGKEGQRRQLLFEIGKTVTGIEKIQSTLSGFNSRSELRSVLSERDTLLQSVQTHLANISHGAVEVVDSGDVVSFKLTKVLPESAGYYVREIFGPQLQALSLNAKIIRLDGSEIVIAKRSELRSLLAQANVDADSVLLLVMVAVVGVGAFLKLVYYMWSSYVENREMAAASRKLSTKHYYEIQGTQFPLLWKTQNRILDGLQRFGRALEIRIKKLLRIIRHPRLALSRSKNKLPRIHPHWFHYHFSPDQKQILASIGLEDYQIPDFFRRTVARVIDQELRNASGSHAIAGAQIPNSIKLEIERAYRERVKRDEVGNITYVNGSRFTFQFSPKRSSQLYNLLNGVLPPLLRTHPPVGRNGQPQVAVVPVGVTMNAATARSELRSVLWIGAAIIGMASLAGAAWFFVFRGRSPRKSEKPIEPSLKSKTGLLPEKHNYSIGKKKRDELLREVTALYWEFNREKTGLDSQFANFIRDFEVSAEVNDLRTEIWRLSVALEKFFRRKRGETISFGEAKQFAREYNLDYVRELVKVAKRVLGTQKESAQPRPKEEVKPVETQIVPRFGDKPILVSTQTQLDVDTNMKRYSLMLDSGSDYHEFVNLGSAAYTLEFLHNTAGALKHLGYDVQGGHYGNQQWLDIFMGVVGKSGLRVVMRINFNQSLEKIASEIEYVLNLKRFEHLLAAEWLTDGVSRFEFSDGNATLTLNQPGELTAKTWTLHDRSLLPGPRDPVQIVPASPRSELRTRVAESFEEAVRLAEAAAGKGWISESALKNILSWGDEAHKIAHADIIAQFQKAGTDANAWKAINDDWYNVLKAGTAGIRGKRGWGTNRINFFTIGLFQLAHANMLTMDMYNDLIREFDPEFNPRTTKKAVALGYDSRYGSYDPKTKQPGVFVKLEALINAAKGVRAYVFREPTSTPQLSFTVHNVKVDDGFKLVSGSMSTASHNPSSDNGNKPYKPDGSQATGQFADGINNHLGIITASDLANLTYRGINILSDIDHAFEVAVANGDIKWIGGENDPYQADEQFIKAELDEAIYSVGEQFDLSYINLQHAKIVISPLYGVSKRILAQILKRRGLRDEQIIWVQDEPNPDFPGIKNGKPNPEAPEAREAALKRAVEVDADLVLWTDPDADRPAVAAKLDRNKKAEGVEDYVSFNGNQQLAILMHYLLDEIHHISYRAADNIKPTNRNSALSQSAEQIAQAIKSAVVASTIVSADLMKIIARVNDARVPETLTGFKYIGDEIEKRAKAIQQAAGVSESAWVKLPKKEKIRLALEHSELFLFGGEESLGSLTSDGPHDKDAIAGVMWFVEILGRLTAIDSDISLPSYLDRIYEDYGYFAELFPMLQKGKKYANVELSEQEAMEVIKADQGPSILNRFRTNPPKAIGGKRVIAVLDFEAQTAESPNGTLLFDSESHSGLITPDTEGIPGFFREQLALIPVPDSVRNKSFARGIYSFAHTTFQGSRRRRPKVLPRENFIKLFLEDGSWVAARPSGTEPVIKFYINGRGLYDERAQVDVWLQSAAADLETIADEVARERFPEKFAGRSELRQSLSLRAPELRSNDDLVRSELRLAAPVSLDGEKWTAAILQVRNLLRGEAAVEAIENVLIPNRTKLEGTLGAVISRTVAFEKGMLPVFAALAKQTGLSVVVIAPTEEIDTRLVEKANKQFGLTDQNKIIIEKTPFAAINSLRKKGVSRASYFVSSQAEGNLASALLQPIILTDALAKEMKLFVTGLLDAIELAQDAYEAILRAA